MLYNGPIEPPSDSTIIEFCLRGSHRSNIFIIMVTDGGNANVAYRIARCLQNTYKRYYFCASGFCKSAGTLIAIGAHELIMSSHGELGHLDIQLHKRDEIGEKQSGKTLDTAIEHLSYKAFEAFEDFFIQLKAKNGGLITVATAAKIAANLTTGFFWPIFQQIDPMNVGETQRALRVAYEYGKLLLDKGKNINENGLSKLFSEYPSHGFVIDITLAKRIFKNVRCTDDIENELLFWLDQIGDYGRIPKDEVFIKMLCDEIQQEMEVKNGKQNQ